MGKHRDWTEIRQDYQENGLSYAALAKKYDVSLDTLKKAAARQGWTKTKEKKQRKEAQLIRSVSSAVKKAEKEMALNGTVQNGTEENGTVEIAPASFTVLPREEPEERFQRLVDGMMDRVEEAIERVPPEAVQALKLLTGALKDLRSLQRMDKDALDIEEQKARIAKLRSETRIIDVESGGGVLILPSIDEALIPPGSDDE